MNSLSVVVCPQMNERKTVLARNVKDVIIGACNVLRYYNEVHSYLHNWSVIKLDFQNNKPFSRTVFS